MKQIKPDKLVFYTAAGLEVEFEPISPILLEESEQGLIAEYRQRGEPLDKPTYTVETVGGGSQIFEHDETTLTTDELKAAWALYKDANDRLQAEQAQLRLEIVMSAIKVELPEDGEWEKRYRRWHVTVPSDADEKRLFYIAREILKTPADLVEAMTRVITTSMKGTVSEEAIEAASASFRNYIQEAVSEAGLDVEANRAAAGQQPGKPGELAAQPDL